MRSLKRFFAASLAIAVLSSCGGGDGSGGPATPPAPPALAITASSAPAGTTGTAYASYTFTASGGTAPLSWTESGPLPPGLTLSASGQLSGNPAVAGTYPILVTVTDSSMPSQTSSAQVGIHINDSAVVITLGTPPAGTVTYLYNGFSFGASGGSGAYSWTESGTLPPGMTLDGEGNLQGTPTKAGTFAFLVTATDTAQPPTSSPPYPTQIVIDNPAPLTLSATPAPPAGVVGTQYGPFAFSASGGFQPLTWRITKGSLALGLTLGSSDGSLNGTPTTAAVSPYSFTVTVTDSASTPVTQALPFSIMVTLPPPPTIAAGQEAPTGTVGADYTPYQFTASNGAQPLAWSEAPPLTMGLTLSAQGVLSGTPTAAGQFPITLNVVDAAGQPGTAPFPTIVRVSLARPPASFSATGSMMIPRSGHAATLLLSGKVLVTGGANGAPDSTAELYDPASGTFSSTKGNMTEARSGHTATLLKLSSPAAANYGKVLIVGSVDTSAELFDPASSTFAATGSLHHERTSPTATLLNSGKVLIVGGNTNSAELYDPTSGTFSDTGSTIAVRTGHTATLLSSGKVLIAGGGSATAELYNPNSGTFTATAGDMTVPRTGHTAILLGAADGVQNSYVLLIGPGYSAEIYDPSTEAFAPVGSLPSVPTLGFNGPRNNTASLRDDGTVLSTGGSAFRHCGVFGPVSGNGGALFAPESDGFTVTGSLHTPRDTHTATVLQDGTVLVVGGTDHFFNPPSVPRGNVCSKGAVVLSSAELFK